MPIHFYLSTTDNGPADAGPFLFQGLRGFTHSNVGASLLAMAA